MEWNGMEWTGGIHPWTQEYTPQPQIDGVVEHKLKVFTDDGGFFCEVAKLAGASLKPSYEFGDFKVRQLNYSILEPKLVKGWHIHREQADVWFIPPLSRLIVRLRDIRKGSPTEGTQMRFTDSGYLLKIPAGVAHGVSNPHNYRQHMMYLVDKQFDLDNPDELRFYLHVWDPHLWEIQNG